MNKTLKALMLALTICAAICGTANAAPRGGNHPAGKTPAVARAQPVQKHAAKAPAKPAVAAHAPAKPAPKAPAHVHLVKSEPRHRDAHHVRPPEPPARHHGPEHHHHDRTLHTEDWCEIGASLIGGLVGGLIGASI
jgi:hypothetical protein